MITIHANKHMYKQNETIHIKPDTMLY